MIERAALEHDIRGFVRQRLDAVASAAADGAPVDLHQDFASRVPTFVLGTLLGIPAADQHRFDPWVRALTRPGAAPVVRSIRYDGEHWSVAGAD